MYLESELAILIPTKGRPHKIKNLLESMVSQVKQPGVLIIIDSGGESKNVVSKYLDKLNIIYRDTDITGQIAQRNHGLELVGEKFLLVAYIDDDIVFESDAIERMINCWNLKEKETAGIGFTITNNPEYRNSLFHRVSGMGSDQPGAILNSGYNVPVAANNQSVKTSWLCGGATVWRAKVIKEFSHLAIKSKWAICEDIIFSYPVSKKYPMYVCKQARVFHDDIPIEQYFNFKNIYRGKNTVLWRMYFVSLHKELSLASFYWMSVCQIGYRTALGILTLKPNSIIFSTGQLIGLLRGLVILMSGRSLFDIINE